MEKSRSWTYKDVDDFFTLTNYITAHLIITPGISLARIFERLTFADEIKEIEAIIGDTATLGTTEEERYGNYLTKVKTTTFGQWLFKDANFGKAHKLFQKKQQAPQNPGYHIEYAELRFYRCAAITGFYILYKDSGKHRPSPTSRQVDQAIKKIIALQESLAKGVRLKDYDKTNQLAGLLAELRETLISTDKKPRNDKTAKDRAFVAILSKALFENFHDISRTIVKHLSGVIGYEVDDTAFAPQIKAAHNKIREDATERVTDALMERQKKTA